MSYRSEYLAGKDRRRSDKGNMIGMLVGLLGSMLGGYQQAKGKADDRALQKERYAKEDQFREKQLQQGDRSQDRLEEMAQFQKEQYEGDTSLKRDRYTKEDEFRQQQLDQGNRSQDRLEEMAQFQKEQGRGKYMSDLLSTVYKSRDEKSKMDLQKQIADSRNKTALDVAATRSGQSPGAGRGMNYSMQRMQAAGLPPPTPEEIDAEMEIIRGNKGLIGEMSGDDPKVRQGAINSIQMRKAFQLMQQKQQQQGGAGGPMGMAMPQQPGMSMQQQAPGLGFPDNPMGGQPGGDMPAGTGGMNSISWAKRVLDSPHSDTDPIALRAWNIIKQAFPDVGVPPHIEAAMAPQVWGSVGTLGAALTGMPTGFGQLIGNAKYRQQNPIAGSGELGR